MRPGAAQPHAGPSCAARGLRRRLGSAALTLTLTLAAMPVLAQSRAQAQAPRSGFDDMSPAVQALQRDDAANPALLWLRAGQQRFAAECMGCHADDALRGAAARYPAADPATGQVFNLAGRIQHCRQQHLGQPPWPREHEDLLALEMAVAHLARGQGLRAAPGAAMDALRARGQALYVQPLGQLELSCAQCHDRHAGARLAGSTIPQGHPNGYPIYRLEWQGIGSLQRRLRGCLTGVRAQPWSTDAPEWLALEAYLVQRGAGLPVETPAVRP